MIKHLMMMTIVIIAAAVVSGCGSLSLFSSRHVHYHGSDEADNKIDELQARIEALEKSAQK